VAGSFCTRRLYAQLVTMGVTSLDPPTEYPYTPGYYAMSCQEPDGLVLECVYDPSIGGHQSQEGDVLMVCGRLERSAR
jgi:hypothetical protein